MGPLVFPKLFPLHSSTNSMSDPIPSCKLHLHRKPARETVYQPTRYALFRDIFCLQRASQLPTHRPWDCAIDLVSGERVPREKITITTGTEGHGGVHRRGAPARLHPLFNVPCCFQIFLRGQEG